MGATSSTEYTAPLLADTAPLTAAASSATPVDGGLTTADAERRRIRFGFNEVMTRRKHPLLKLAANFWGPMPWLIELAAVVSGALEDWKDFAFLTALLVINGLVAFFEEFKAGNAIDALKKSLAPTARVLRDGSWTVLPARELVPDDVIILTLGDVVPADSVLGSGEGMEVDQAALTGESLPVTKFEGELVYQGSVIKRGELRAVVSATGKNSFFGKAASLVDSVDRPGNFQKVLFNMSKIIVALALVLVTVIFFVLIFSEGSSFGQAIKLCLVLMVASIPIAMQVVCTATMAVGSRALAAKDAVVARLSAIEELAGMTILCCDKTGTLTKNELTLGESHVLTGDVEALHFTAALACRHEGEIEPIDRAITASPLLASAPHPISSFEVMKFVPFDPTRKRTEATVRGPDGAVCSVSKGSPQVICRLVGDEDVTQRVGEVVDSLAARGFRTLGVARTRKGQDESSWEFVGVLSLFDPPRDDTADTVANAARLGNEVKMITADHVAIARETARQLGLGTNIVKPEVFASLAEVGGALPPHFLTQHGGFIANADGFAEVMPEHKLAIVDVLQQRQHMVGMTGDGVNDAPALKQANIGIAVQGATDAARAAADIVLTAPGLSVIIDAIVLSRMIFQRVKNYCTYRIACTIQILLFFFLAICWQGFQIPVFVICIISILNDGTIMSIAYDSVVPSIHPEAWDLPRTCSIACTIGLVGVVSTFFLLYLANTCTICMDYAVPGDHASGCLRADGFFSWAFGLHPLSYAQTQALIYLQLSISGQATIFVARTRSFFFTQPPGAPLACAFVVAQTISTLLTVYVSAGLEPMEGLGVIVPGDEPGRTTVCWDSDVRCTTDYASGWKYAGLCWAYCAIWLLVQDVMKLGAYRLLDYADPATEERRGLLDRKQLLARHSRASGPSRPGTNATRSTQGTFDGEAGPSGAYRRSLHASQTSQSALEAMLDPQVRHGGVPSDLRSLVESLESRVKELEAQLGEREALPSKKTK